MTAIKWNILHNTNTANMWNSTIIYDDGSAHRFYHRLYFKIRMTIFFFLFSCVSPFCRYAVRVKRNKNRWWMLYVIKMLLNIKSVANKLHFWHFSFEWSIIKCGLLFVTKKERGKTVITLWFWMCLKKRHSHNNSKILKVVNYGWWWALFMQV